MVSGFKSQSGDIVKLPVSISEFKLCDCGKGNWVVTGVEIDNEVELRIRTIVSPKYRKRFLKELEEGKISKKIYIIHRKCMNCGFVPPSALVTERMLKFTKEERREQIRRRKK